jgi:anionic cell wall polymer biosynthesis LytR-Cps2A-Psr (LCP) family protein
MGGLDINVDNTFDDYQYPLDGKETDSCGHTDAEIEVFASDSAEQLVQNFPCRYKQIHFDKGLNHMSGETALEFVRSRYATQTIERSDFARSKRQEKVIKAFKDKVLSAQTFINPAKIISLYNVLSGSIDTDIKQNEFDDFIRLAQKMQSAKIQSGVLDAGDEKNNRPGLLINPQSSADYGYAWVLTPRIGDGNFSEIQQYISCEITLGNCSISVNSKN